MKTKHAFLCAVAGALGCLTVAAGTSADGAWTYNDGTYTWTYSVSKDEKSGGEFASLLRVTPRLRGVVTFPAYVTTTFSNELGYVKHEFDEETLSNRTSWVQTRGLKLEVREVPVREIYIDSWENQDLTGLVMPDTLERFYGDFDTCSNLTAVAFPAKTKYVGSYAFKGCVNLTQVDLPASTELHVTAFLGTPWQMGQGEFFVRGNMLVAYQGQGDAVTVPDGVTVIGESAFDAEYNPNCTNLTSVALPTSVTEIREFAFWGCRNMASIALPPRLKRLGGENKYLDDCEPVGSVFANCENLTSIVIPDSVDAILECTFEGCSRLASVTLGSGVKEIGSCAFENCGALASLTLPEGLRKIGESAFTGCVGLQSVHIPDSVAFLGSYAFGFCTNLTTVTGAHGVCGMYDSMVFDGDYEEDYFDAFDGTALVMNAPVGFVTAGGILLGYNNPEVYDDENGWYFPPMPEELVVPAGTTFIASPGWFCESYYGVKTLTLPDSVRKIGTYAFNYMPDLVSLRLGNGVEKICGYVFVECPALTSLDIGGSVTNIGYKVFSDTPALMSVAGGGRLEKMNYSAFSGSGFAQEMWNSMGREDVPFSLVRVGGALMGYKGVVPGGTLVIPADVTCITDEAFSGLCGVTDVVGGESLVGIGEWAFCGGDVRRVNITAQEMNIGRNAFSDCWLMESVKLSGIERLGEGVFTYCSGLTNAMLSGSFTELPCVTFEGCENLVDVTLEMADPGRPFTVWSDAFKECARLQHVDVVCDGRELMGWDASINGLDETFAADVQTFQYVGYKMMLGYYCNEEEGMYDIVSISYPLRANFRRVAATEDDILENPFVNTVSSAYKGWLMDAEGRFAGMLDVKIAKAGKDGLSTATVTVELIGQKAKISLKGKVDAAGNGQGVLAGLLFGAKGVTGALTVNGGSYAVSGGADASKNKKDEDNLVFERFKDRVYTLVFETPRSADLETTFAAGFAGFSVKFSSNGKAKTSGVLPDGFKVAQTTMLIIGGDNCALPVACTKTKDTFGFILWFDREGELTDVTDVTPWVASYVQTFETQWELVAAGEMKAFDSVPVVQTSADDVTTRLFGNALSDFLPVYEPFTVSGTSWAFAKGATVKYKKGVFDQAAYDKDYAKGKTNGSNLKLTYTPKTGTFKGSYAIYVDEGGKLKKYTSTVNGVIVDGVGYGAGLVKKVGSVPVVVGEP